jgi:hypothetical protein
MSPEFATERQKLEVGQETMLNPFASTRDAGAHDAGEPEYVMTYPAKASTATQFVEL